MDKEKKFDSIYKREMVQYEQRKVVKEWVLMTDTDSLLCIENYEKERYKMYADIS